MSPARLLGVSLIRIQTHLRNRRSRRHGARVRGSLLHNCTIFQSIILARSWPSILVEPTCELRPCGSTHRALRRLASRVCEVVLHGDKTFSLRQQKYRVTEALKTGEATALFGACLSLRQRSIRRLFGP